MVVPPFHTPKWSFLVRTPEKPMGLLGKPTILRNPHIYIYIFIHMNGTYPTAVLSQSLQRMQVTGDYNICMICFYKMRIYIHNIYIYTYGIFTMILKSIDQILAKKNKHSARKSTISLAGVSIAFLNFPMPEEKLHPRSRHCQLLYIGATGS